MAWVANHGAQTDSPASRNEKMLARLADGIEEADSIKRVFLDGRWLIVADTTAAETEVSTLSSLSPPSAFGDSMSPGRCVHQFHIVSPQIS
jgi:hypothetical protein